MRVQDVGLRGLRVFEVWGLEVEVLRVFRAQDVGFLGAGFKV